MPRKNYAGSAEGGAHFSLDEYESVIVYQEAQSRKIDFSDPYDSRKKKSISEIAKLINNHRIETNSKKSRPKATHLIIRSFLKHAYRQGLTIDDFI